MTHRDNFTDDNGYEHTFSSDETHHYMKMLTEQYGRFNAHSEFSLFEPVRYLRDGQEQVGAIMWAIEATQEQVAQYIIRPLSIDHEPDMVDFSNIIGLATEEQAISMQYVLTGLHILYPVASVGCYYTDAENNPWTTFEAINHTETCSACGASIGSGYSRGKLGEETYFCGEHIHIKPE